MNTYRSTKDIAADVREELKVKLPHFRFSVRTKVFSMGSSITVSLVSGPEPVLLGYAPQRGVVPDLPTPGYAQLNQYQFNDARYEEMRQNNGYILSEAGWSVMKRAYETLAQHHWDKSDIQSDYFSCNFYMHLQIGDWNKDYQVKGGK